MTDPVMTAPALSAAPRMVATAAGPVECVIFGDGPPLLAIHGGMGGHDQSTLLARALVPGGTGHRVIAVSRPGYLGTALDRGATPEAQADLYAALLDALGIDRVTIAAVSAGGPSALAFAARHPARCRSLILVSACSGRLETPPGILRRLGWMRIMARVPGLMPLLHRRIARDPAAAARRAIPDPGLREATLRHAEAGPLLAMLQQSVFRRLADRIPGTANDIRRLAGLAAPPPVREDIPVLVIHGEADEIVPFAHSEAVRRATPHARLVAIPGGGHVALFTHLEPIRRAVAELTAIVPA